MKKFLGLLLVVTILLPLLASCGEEKATERRGAGSSAEIEPSSAEETSEPAETAVGATPGPTGSLPDLPAGKPVRLIFIHHSTGENWLADDNGGLGLALRDHNYFVSDTNYGWGPDSIGDTTD
ncbi:MAG: hypothetical protein M1358_00130, partial [Chloroflexi bacterium]|nr:hypothetical protein [Chloroflexota bacterium]